MDFILGSWRLHQTAKRILMIYIWEAGMMVITIVVADIHAQRYDDNIPISKWWHSFWLIPFAAICAAYYLIHKDIQGTTQLALERSIFFAPILNLLRKKLNAAGFLNRFFYIHGESNNGSFWDRQLEKLGKLWPFLWAAFFILFVYLNGHRL
jgi:hypothetical protein